MPSFGSLAQSGSQGFADGGGGGGGNMFGSGGNLFSRAGGTAQGGFPGGVGSQGFPAFSGGTGGNMGTQFSTYRK